MENKPVTSMYSKTPAYIYGFHGCTKEVFDKVIYQNQPMKKAIMPMTGWETEYISGRTAIRETGLSKPTVYKWWK